MRLESGKAIPRNVANIWSEEGVRVIEWRMQPIPNLKRDSDETTDNCVLVNSRLFLYNGFATLETTHTIQEHILLVYKLNIP